MNTAAIGDSVCTVAPRESVGSDRAPGLFEDHPQQRFADVLPLAEAALERPVREAGTHETPAQGQSSDAEERRDDARIEPPAEDTGTGGTGDTASAETPDLASLPGGPLANLLQPAIQGRIKEAVQIRGKGPITEVHGRSDRVDAKGHRNAVSHDMSSAAEAGTEAPGNARVAHRSSHRSSPPSAESSRAGVATGSTGLKTGDAAASGAVAGQQGPATNSESSTQVAATGSQGASGGQPAVKNAMVQDSQGAPSGNPVPQVDGANAQANTKLPAGAQAEPTPEKTAQVSPHRAAATNDPRPQSTASENPAQALHIRAENAGEQGARLARAGSSNLQEGAGRDGTGSQTRNPASGSALPASSQESGPRVARSKDAVAAAGENRKSSPRTENGAQGNSVSEATDWGVKEMHTAGSKESGSVLSNPSILSGSESVSSTPRVAGQTQSPMGLDTPLTRTPTQSVGEQILDSLHAAVGRGDRQVLVRLNPPELGTVVVRFQEQGDQVSAMLEVGSREVRREIEQALPQVVRSLQEAGVQVRKLEVVASEQPERDPTREQLPQDTWSQQQQQQGSGHHREHLHASFQARWPQDMTNSRAGREDAVTDESRPVTPQDRIDMLL